MSAHAHTPTHPSLPPGYHGLVAGLQLASRPGERLPPPLRQTSVTFRRAPKAKVEVVTKLRSIWETPPGQRMPTTWRTWTRQKNRRCSSCRWCSQPVCRCHYQSAVVAVGRRSVEAPRCPNRQRGEKEGRTLATPSTATPHA